MARATSSMTHANAAVGASGTSVAASSEPLDNCHTILVTNPDEAKTVLVGLGTAGGALTAGVSAQRVPPSYTLVLSVGQINQRGAYAPGGTGWIYDSIGGAVTAEVTYLNQIGGG